jgi:anhydro-N-acetylmuramic acid kinase
VDAVAVDLARLPPRAIGYHREPVPPDLRQRLSAPERSEAETVKHMAELDFAVGSLFAQTAQGLLAATRTACTEILALGCHGPMLRYQPSGAGPFLVQAGDPNAVADLTAITTVSDFRRGDVAAGGRGAPLTAAFHAAAFRSRQTNRVVLHVGPIAGITMLPRDPDAPLAGFDTGPGTSLLDAWAARHLYRPFDDGGRWAAGGTADSSLLSALLSDAYFALDPPKIAQPCQFPVHWLDAVLQQVVCPPQPQDVQATSCELTAASVSYAIARAAPQTEEVLACGGGAYNRALMARLKYWLGDCRIVSAASCGMAPDAVEAMAFAWLARETTHRRPGNVPSVTGARRPVVLGGVYYGNEPASKERADAKPRPGH